MKNRKIKSPFINRSTHRLLRTSGVLARYAVHPIVLLHSFSMLICLSACISRQTDEPAFRDYKHQAVPYRLYAPDRKIRLHWDLEEISGLAYYKDSLLGAVEDERGKIYLLNTRSGKIIRKVKFGKGGDYEGIEFDGHTAWVMKSNGNFFSFDMPESDRVKATVHESPFGADNDLEGLGMVDGQLLVACKRKGNIKGVDRKGKGLYLTIDAPKPYLFIRMEDLRSFIKEKVHFNEIRDFDPSAVAVHPVSKDIYILSADHILVVYDLARKIREVVKLDKGIYTQPEGLCFDPQGNLYLSSEGDGRRGELFVFHPLPDHGKEEQAQK